jgi:hypothetical protein
MQRRCRLNEELARPSGFERFMPIVVKAEFHRRCRVKQELLHHASPSKAELQWH